MLPGLTTLFIVCMVVMVSAQDNTTLRMGVGENKCQTEVATCTDKYGNNDKNQGILQYYYNCVWRVPCKKHEEGYNELLTLLSAIDEELEALRANSGNWWNAGSSLDVSLVIMLISLATVFKELIYKAY
uniref:Uncharacterized protein n=1 Tax=Arion vulgaris TaxID=1028688 RepID=A0A0B7A4B3_9EUPU